MEIEAKSEQGAEVARVASDSLLERFGPELRRWDHSKVAMGKAIERLLGEGRLQGLIEADGTLKPEGYDQSDAVLRQAEI